jgi:hypothetical protein
MAETAITTVLSKCGELATREAGVLLQVGHDVMLLRDRLDWLQAFIRDADRKRRAGTDGFTLVWLRQTRNVTFEAEDTLDYFYLKVQSADIDPLLYIYSPCSFVFDFYYKLIVTAKLYVPLLSHS